MNNVGAEICRIRKKRGWSQRKLALLANTPQSVISTLESQHTINPRIDTLQKLANALDISLAELFSS